MKREPARIRDRPNLHPNTTVVPIRHEAALAGSPRRARRGRHMTNYWHHGNTAWDLSFSLTLHRDPSDHGTGQRIDQHNPIDATPAQLHRQSIPH